MYHLKNDARFQLYTAIKAGAWKSIYKTYPTSHPRNGTQLFETPQDTKRHEKTAHLHATVNDDNLKSISLKGHVVDFRTLLVLFYCCMHVVHAMVNQVTWESLNCDKVEK